MAVGANLAAIAMHLGLGRSTPEAMSRADQAGAALARVSEAMDNGFSYAGGSFGEANWLKKLMMRRDSARQSVMRDIGYLIGESRYLAKYHPIVKNIVELKVNWTVGTGFNHKYQMPKGWSKSRKANFEKAVRKWLETSQIDANRRYNVWQLDELIQRTIDVSGSIVLIFRRVRIDDMARKGLAIPLMVEQYEPEMIYLGTAPKDLRARETFRDGYALDEDMRPVAIYLWSKHPSEGTGQALRCDLYDSQGEQQVFHLFGPDRPGALAGLPAAVAVVQRAHNMADYIMSLLDRMREDSKITRYVKMGPSIGFRPNLFNSGGMDSTRTGAEYTANGAPAPGMTPTTQFISQQDAADFGVRVGEALLDNNTVPVIPDGWSIEEGQMTQTNGFPDFYKELKRELASGMGVPYTLGGNDSKGGSFSSSKIDLTMLKISSRKRQNYLISNWREPLWDAMLRSLKAIALCPKNDDVPCQHRPDPFEMIEPTKETDAMIAKLDAGLASWEDVVSALGEDPEELFEKIVAWRDRFADAGIPLAPLSYKAKGGDQTPAPSADDEEDDESTPTTPAANEDDAAPEEEAA